MSRDSTPTATPEGSIYTPTDMSSSTSNLSFSQASFLEHPTPSQTSALSDIASSVSSITTNTDDEAEEEWQESLRELNMLVSLVVIPFFGKWVGRKCAYWVWGRFMSWRHPVDIIITNRGVFNTAGTVGALAMPAPSL